MEPFKGSGYFILIPRIFSIYPHPLPLALCSMPAFATHL